MIIAAADGSSLSNPGPAGWAWYIDDATWAAGGWPVGTNNMGELMAVLDLVRQTAVVADEPLRVLCDSQYAINAISKWLPAWKARGWRKTDGHPVLNRELLEAIDRALVGREVTFEWVKGHAGHRLNEAADARARAAATAFQEDRPVAAGPGFTGNAVPAVSLDVAPARPAAAAPDLFTTAAPADAGDAADVVALEQSLDTELIRRSPLRLRELVHPDYVAYDAQGHITTRSRLLATVRPLERVPDVELLGTTRLAPDVWLLRWRRRSGTRSVLGSSVWVEAAPAGWQILFTQSTPAS